MLALMKVFVDIVFWRKGPQDLPASTLLLAVCVAAVLGLNLAIAGVREAFMPPDPLAPQSQFLYAIIEPALVLGWLWLLLALFRRPGRFRQSATALMGIGLVLSPVLLGSSLVAVRVGQDSRVAWSLAAGVVVVVSVWYLLAVAHILRSALETRLFPAIVLTLVFMTGVWFVQVGLFGASA